MSLYLGMEAKFMLANQHGRSGDWSALTAHVKDEEVKEFASQLRSAGIDAYEWGESIEGGKGVVFGIIVADIGFFPVWELNKPDNQGLLAARDFASIKAKRSADWEPVEPHLWRKVRGRS
jgi:hypothetical protein